MRALYALLLLPTLAAAQDPPPLLVCPGTITVSPTESVAAPQGWRALPAPRTHWLRAARLFSGDPSERADLVPDNPRPRNYGWTFRAGASPPNWLVCDYEGTEASITAAVPPAATRCTVTTYFDNSRGMRGGLVVIGPGNWVRAQCR